MKSFLKQINESFQALDEKDWDGDGEHESDTEEYMGVKDRAIKKAMKKEAAKPDYLDFNKNGNKNEPMKDALEDVECEKCSGAGCDHCDGTGYHKKVDEMSTTAGVASVTTPYAWKDPKKEAKKYTYEQVQKAMDHKYEQLIEGYRDFALSDAKMSPVKKVNSSIREVAKKLKEIEETVKYTGRLKTESGIAHSGFSSGTHNALRKISERLIKISERVRSLGE
jgi:hypothetical protein